MRSSRESLLWGEEVERSFKNMWIYRKTRFFDHYDRESETERERDREGERQRGRETERESRRDRETERERQRGRDRERERGRERGRKTEGERGREGRFLLRQHGPYRSCPEGGLSLRLQGVQKASGGRDRLSSIYSGDALCIEIISWSGLGSHVLVKSIVLYVHVLYNT